MTLPRLPWRSILIGAVAAALFAAGWLGNGWRLGEQIAELKAEHATEQRKQARVQTKAVDDARIEEQRRVAEQVKSTNDAIRQLHEAQASARAADAARRELLARITAITNAARSPRDPASVAAGASAGDPILLLADVLGRADQRAGDLAQYADAARVAGQKCERDYDALISTTP